MKIERVNLVRFRSFTQRAVLRVPAGGLVYVTGENRAEPDLEGNGVGKTTLFEAPYWCFFGKTSGRLKAGDVANWEEPKGCSVTVIGEFLGNRRTVTRQWGPNLLTIDGKEVDQTTLEKELGVSPDNYTYAYYFPQGQESFLDLKPEQVMGLLTDILKLNIWDTASSLASKEAQELDSRVSKAQGKIEESAQFLIETGDNSLRKHEEEWEEERKAEIAKLQKELSKARILLNGNLGAIEDEIKTLYKGEAENKATMKQAGNNLGQLRKLSGGKCPTCGSKLDREHLKKEIKTWTVEYDAAERCLKEVQELIEEKEEKKSKLTKAKAKANERESIRRSIEKAVAEVNPYTEQRRKVEKQLFQLRLSIAKLKADSKQLTSQQELVRFWVKGFKEVRLLVVDNVIAQLEMEVNQVIRELGLKGWGVSFTVEKENKAGGISRGFSTLVKSPRNHNPVPWGAWSGGEAQRLRLAGTMGFANLIHSMSGNSPNLELWDEPSSWMSARGIDQMFASLKDRAERYNRCIMVADHRIVDFGGFDGRIRIVKEKEGSRIDNAPSSPYSRTLQLGTRSTG